VRRIVPALIDTGTYDYPYVGASFDDEISLTEQRARGLTQTPGAYVMSVTAGGPADRAGLVAASPSTGLGGDLIVALDGQPIANFQELNSYLVFHTSVGQTIKVTVLRDGKESVLSLKLGSRP
jgi:serine protease Do